MEVYPAAGSLFSKLRGFTLNSNELIWDEFSSKDKSKRIQPFPRPESHESSINQINI